MSQFHIKTTLTLNPSVSYYNKSNHDIHSNIIFLKYQALFLISIKQVHLSIVSASTQLLHINGLVQHWVTPLLMHCYGSLALSHQ